MRLLLRGEQVSEAEAHLFHFAEAAGGWGAAQMICEALGRSDCKYFLPLMARESHGRPCWIATEPSLTVSSMTR